MDATTAIGKHTVADKVAKELASTREEHLKTPLSPNERQSLFEVGYLVVEGHLHPPQLSCRQSGPGSAASIA